MRHHEKVRARRLFTEWLQKLTAENRASLASMIGELSDWQLKEVIESGTFAEVEAAEKHSRERALKEKIQRDGKLQRESADRERRAREFRAGRLGYIPNAPSDLPIYRKLAEPPEWIHPERTNCNYDLVNERCEFMKYEDVGAIGQSSWKCCASLSK